MGYSRDSARSIRDFWEYDPNSDQWTRKANFPGAEREGATGFAIANKGYIAGATDLWEYDPAIDQWTRKADFPGTSRTFAACFSAGSKGYVGTGYSSGAPNLPLDFWEYDAATNRWTQKADFPGPGRFKAVGFSILGKGYIGTGGIDPNANLSTTYNDFWEYDPATNQWNRKADLPGGNREGAIAWSIGTYGYVGAGFKFQPGGGNYKDYWQFNPAANKWNRTSDGEYASSVGTFAIGNSGYYVEFKNEGYPPKVYQFTVR